MHLSLLYLCGHVFAWFGRNEEGRRRFVQKCISLALNTGVFDGIAQLLQVQFYMTQVKISTSSGLLRSQKCILSHYVMLSSCLVEITLALLRRLLGACSVLPVCTSMCFLPSSASGVLGLNCSLARFRAMALLLASCCLCISIGSGCAVCQRYTYYSTSPFLLYRTLYSFRLIGSDFQYWVSTYNRYDVLGICVSPDNSTIIHDVSIIGLSISSTLYEKMFFHKDITASYCDRVCLWLDTFLDSE